MWIFINRQSGQRLIHPDGWFFYQIEKTNKWTCSDQTGATQHQITRDCGSVRCSAQGLWNVMRWHPLINNPLPRSISFGTWFRTGSYSIYNSNYIICHIIYIIFYIYHIIYHIIYIYRIYYNIMILYNYIYIYTYWVHYSKATFGYVHVCCLCPHASPERICYPHSRIYNNHFRHQTIIIIIIIHHHHHHHHHPYPSPSCCRCMLLSPVSV